MGDLSEHFSRREFNHHGDPLASQAVAEELIAGLEVLRALVGGYPLRITPGGGLRPPSEPAARHRSLHELGEAADLTCPAIPLRDLHEAALKIPQFAASGVGLYPGGGFVHVDVGRPAPMRWVRIQGIYYYY